MSAVDRTIQAAIGFSELGMFVEANEEIENLEPEIKTSSPVLGVRLEIYRAAEKWTLMEVVAKELWKRHQDQPLFWNHHAYAVRRSTGLEEAHKILSEALEKFPDDSTTIYNLGCYHCQLGDLESAKERVGDAIKLDPQWKIHALNDPDLEPLWEMWSQT
jgi:tetratricopeptide (TPR) repeat protein